MKSTVSLVLLLIASSMTFGQLNMPDDPFGPYCKHMTSALKHQYYVPQVANPLLDQYDMKFVFLDLEVENNSLHIEGNVTIHSKVVSPTMDTFALELIPEMVIQEVAINSFTTTNIIRQGDDVYLPLPTSLANGDEIIVSVTYAGDAPTGSFFAGVSTAYSSQWDKNVTWTLSEPYAAKEWWPTKQVLTDKIDSCWVFLTTSNENMAGSQGLLTGVSTVPGNKLRYEWKSNYPIAYYLISFAVADYQEYNIYAHPEGLNDSILIQNFIYDSPGCLENYQDGIDRTADFIELYSELFGMYPFPEEKYGHCLTQLGGGMEHQTMTTIGGFGFGLVAHELGHMWYGDNVTCATWNDIWINEGFATYSDYLANENILGYAAAQQWLTARHQQVKQQPGGSVYVPDEELGNIWRIFDGRLSYSKGALLLHMIRWELNDDDVFFEIMHEFTEQYADSTATGDDFEALVDSVSGIDFDYFFDQWYYGEGYPIFDITWNQDEDNFYLQSTQTTSTNVTTLFKVTIPVHVTFQDGTDTTFRFFQDANFEQFSAAISQPVEEVSIDPEQWILHKLNSLLVVLDEIQNPVSFSFGPNPATDMLNIFLVNSEQVNYTLKIFDVTGRLVMNRKLSGEKVTVDIRDLSKGVYNIEISDGENTLTKKLVKE